MDYTLQTIYENMQVMDRIETLNDQGDVNTMGTMGAPEEACESEHDQHFEQEADMADSALMAIQKHAQCIAGDIKHMPRIPGWVQAKLTICSEYLSDVADFVDYEAQKMQSQHCSIKAVVMTAPDDTSVYM